MLHHAFMAEYSNSHRPIDVMVVGTINNILRGKSGEKIIRDLERFQKDAPTISGFVVSTHHPFSPEGSAR